MSRVFSNNGRGAAPAPQGSEETVTTYIGTNVSVEGTLRGKGLLRIDGKVSGTVEHEGTVVVASGAEVKANLRVKELIVQGYVEGQLTAERCEIAETGHVVGKLSARRVTIAEGATVRSELFANVSESADAAPAGRYPVRLPETQAESAKAEAAAAESKS